MATNDEGEDKRAEEEEESREITERSSPSGKIIYHAILKEADEELDRSSSALFWSALAAGLSMGTSLIAEAILHAHLPDTPWRPLVAKLGYSVGFLIVILGRQQLFTENTLTPILPLLLRKDGKTLANVARLWVVILIANMIGAAIIALAASRTPALEPDVRAAMIEIGHKAIAPGFLTVFTKGIFAGWLIAMIVWLLPFAEAARFFVIITITYVVGIANLSHIVAGAVEVFGLAWTGEKPIIEVFTGFIIPALLGNIIGGVVVVAVLNHAQIVSGGEAEE